MWVASVGLCLLNLKVFDQPTLRHVALRPGFGHLFPQPSGTMAAASAFGPQQGEWQVAEAQEAILASGEGDSCGSSSA